MRPRKKGSHLLIFVGKISINTLCVPDHASFLSLYRHGFHDNWHTTTIFVLHLAFCDLLYCSINLPFYAHVYLGHEWQFGEGWCVGSVILAFIFANVDWMALSLIALSRALSLFDPSFLHDFLTEMKSRLVILFVWILVIIFMIPAFLEVILTTKTKCTYRNLTLHLIMILA